MSYPSVDALQRTLADTVFKYAADKKKAAGRALGTLVEIITFYTLKSWGFRNNIAIERPLSEYANAGISHNVEYSLHPVIAKTALPLENYILPLASSKLRRELFKSSAAPEKLVAKTACILSRTGVLRKLLREVIDSNDLDLLSHFILTVGVVSNHGNWFTAEDHNKELKVLAQSYDWLLFLSDKGLAEFINELLLHPTPQLKPAKDAFLASYPTGKGNRFTKKTMDVEADIVLKKYFQENEPRVDSWFNVISPAKSSIQLLQKELLTLHKKDWKKIYGL